MRVAMLGPGSKQKGGIATVIKNFKENFQFQNTEILFYSTWEEGNLFSRLLITIQSIFLFPLFINRNQIDVVHLHVAQAGSFYRKSLFLIISRLMNRPVILHMHASQFDKFYKKRGKSGKIYIKWIFEKASSVVVLSESWLKFYQTIADSHFIVMENAVPLPKVNYYNPHSKNIVSFGRLGKRKGTYDILDLAKRIKKNYPMYTFIVYGDGEIQAIREIIENQNIANVKIGGWIAGSKKNLVMEDIKLHLLPSYNEGMPMSILETMGYGIPNIASSVGGIPKVITSGKNGYLVQPGDIDSIEKYVIEVIENRDKTDKMSQESYLTIKNQFSIEVYHKKWNDLYQQTLK